MSLDRGERRPILKLRGRQATLRTASLQVLHEGSPYDSARALALFGQDRSETPNRPESVT